MKMESEDILPILPTIPIIPIELVIEMGKYDIGLYQLIRRVSKVCRLELAKFDLIGSVVRHHDGIDKLYTGYYDFKNYKYDVYCPVRKLTETGFVEIACAWSQEKQYGCSNYIKRARTWTLTGKKWTVEFVDGLQITHLEYDDLERKLTRTIRVRSRLMPISWGDIVSYEQLWPKTGTTRVYRQDSGAWYRLIYRHDGTLNYIEDRVFIYGPFLKDSCPRANCEITREYYDKTGAKVVAQNRYVIGKYGNYRCVETVITPGWY